MHLSLRTAEGISSTFLEQHKHDLEDGFVILDDELDSLRVFPII